MKTLILYATKYGASREIANRIATIIGGSVTFNIKDNNYPDLAGYDCIILGSPLYAGMIHKEAKAFISKHLNLLLNKKLGLYLCGIDASRESEYFTANFPAELLSSARETAFLGGIFDPKKAGLMERIIMKAVAKHSAYTDTIDNSKIDKFTKEILA